MNDTVDMAQFTEAKSDQLNADDLIGVSKTITITKVTGKDGDQPISIYYEGDNGKPFKPCKTIRRVLMGVWGRYANDYIGRSMTLYRDDNVTFGGLEVGGIRISHMTNIDKETIIVVNKSKGKKVGMKILPLVEQSAPKALTIDDARAAIASSASLDDLKKAWSAKAMAPFRDELQEALDARKAQLSFASEVTEAELPSISDWGYRLEQAEVIADVLSVEREFKSAKALPEDDARNVGNWIATAKARFGK